MNPFQTKSITFLGIALLASATFLPLSAQAIEITDTNVEIRNDFVLEPAKLELILNPGQTITKSISVVNRLDRPQNFKIEIEDFTGSKDPNQTVLLLGQDQGPYSLKSNIELDSSTFTLKPKQRAVIPITITVPQNAEAGGKYASVLVSTESGGVTDSGAKTISRIGALFLVRVTGNVNESGLLKDFRMTEDNNLYEKGPYNFELLFENNGSVHLVPNGTIEINNMFGKTIETLDVPPFFSLPDSLRGIQTSWSPDFSFGRYTASAKINRGYESSADQQDVLTVSFWVLPWKIVVGVLAILILIAFLIRVVTRNFQIRRK